MADLWPLLVPTVVYALICALSVFWASDSVRATMALVRLGKDLLLFVLVAAAIEGVGGLRRAAWAVVIAGILTGAAPIAQWYTGDYQNDLWGFARVELARLSARVSRGFPFHGHAFSLRSELFRAIAAADRRARLGLLWSRARSAGTRCRRVGNRRRGTCIVLSYSRRGMMASGPPGAFWWRVSAHGGGAPQCSPRAPCS